MGSATPQSFVELWQIYVKGLQKLAQLWAELLQQSIESASRTAIGDSSALFEPVNFYWNIYEKTFGSFLQSPSFGYTREFNHKLLGSFDSWINFYKASFDYQLVLLDVWARAFDELMRELASSEDQSKTIQNWRQFLQVWSSIFDRVFAQTFRSNDTLQIRGKLLNAAATYRLHQQQLMEVFLKMNDLPTRSEVDEVHRSIYEMRKEIKSLKKAVAEPQSQDLGQVQPEAKH
jgi:class III poly(R)-hydroxyalkanoic acid synthase PhaE subunit